MKILIINKSYQLGGAAVASKRLFKALLKKGVETSMLVFDPLTDVESDVISLTKSFLQKVKWWFYFIVERLNFLPHEKDASVRFSFSPAFIGTDITKHPLFVEADIIHLNWLNQGFLSLHSIDKIVNSGKPIVITMHDMWTITGGCHHSWGCKNFTIQCGNCKFLKNPKPKDLSNKVFLLKGKIFSNKKINIVSVSNWLNDLVNQSPLFVNSLVLSIPNIVDGESYICIKREDACRQLEIDPTKKYILFGAHRIDDNIKGIDYLIKALDQFDTESNDVVVLLFGGKPKDAGIFNQIRVPIKYFGIADLELKLLLYSASDITCTPSLYETFGLVAAESMSCETPVLAFNNSGITDVVDHLKNGYLAEYKSSDDLAKGIKWILENNKDNVLGKAAREKVLREFSEEVVAQKYIDLYQSLLNDK